MRVGHPLTLLVSAVLVAALLPRPWAGTAALLPPTPLSPPAPWHYLTPADQAQLRALVAADLRRPQPTPDGYTAQLVEQQLVATFTPDGLTVRPTHGVGWRWAVQAVGLGRADSLTPLGPVAPTAAAQVRYARAAVEEWYRLGGAGIEQGFTVAAPPAGTGPLRLALRVTTDLVGEAASARDAVWRDAAGAERLGYRGLRAWDAAGRELGARLEVMGDALAVWVDDTAARYPLTIDPLVQQAKLVASDGAAGDFFGLSVALSADGNTALVGADGKNGFQGAAYVFVRSGTTWSQQQKLTAADGAVFDNFSLSVALSGDGNTALVGAYGKNGQQGAAYVFVRSGTTWSQQQKLTASDGAAGDQFGGSVALSGDDNTALVGAVAAKIGSNIQQGAAYVFAQPPIPTPTSTATATPTATPSATATSTPTPTATATPTCATVGAVCHATLAPGGPNGLFASGPLAPGPCAPPAASNCLQTTSTGSFTVQGTLAGLPSGAQAALSLPVVNAQGALLGARAVLCPPAGPTGSMACSGAVAEPGVFPQLGGLVGLRLLAAVALAAPVPLLPPPVAPLPPPVVLPPLPAPLVPPPPPPAAPAPAFPKVPVIPEAESLALLLGGLLGFLGLRRLRRR
ncbi:MAG TPA: FG-GAP repeat protein [Chloroflexota bacterium]|nr:FG-GAP repeat protein [Chloroflexota bacterium]